MTSCTFIIALDLRAFVYSQCVTKFCFTLQWYTFIREAGNVSYAVGASLSGLGRLCSWLSFSLTSRVLASSAESGFAGKKT